MSQPFPSGVHSFAFPTLNSLANGPLNYAVRIGNVTYSGILIKSLP